MSATTRFQAVAGRVVAALEEETAALAAGRWPDGRALADRKAVLLHELTSAARALDPSAPALRPTLTRLRAATAANHAAIGLRLAAARRVADTLRGVVADIESDGTYAAAGLLRAAREAEAGR